MSTITGTLDDDCLYDKLGLQTDRIYGLAGNDTIFMADDKGYDLVDGGDGYDLVSYECLSIGEVSVTIKLFLGTAKDGFGYVDTLVNIEDAVGTNYDDEIWGDAGANVLDGLCGDDEVYGLEGNDCLYGGSGEDFLEGGTGADKN